MAAPKIKMYLLPPGYTQDTDDDVRQRLGDELLPCVAKQESLDHAEVLTGIVPFVGADCIMVQTGLIGDLLNSGEGRTVNYDYTQIVAPSGAYAPYVQELSPYQYEIVAAEDGSFDHVKFLIPEGSLPGTMHLKFYRKGTAGNLWALPHSSPYDGSNTSGMHVIGVVTGCSTPSLDNVPLDLEGYLSGTSQGLLSLPFTCTTLKVWYWAKNQVSHYFAGDHSNWIAEHMRMWPDVFVGTTDYPGDDGPINGVPVIQGTVPQFRDIGTYAIEYRSGFVRFPELIDGRSVVVRANYAHLTNINNVTGQKMFPTDGTNTRYHVNDNSSYTEAEAKRWVGRDDQYLPRNIYVDGVLAGVPVSVTTPETLTIKSS